MTTGKTIALTRWTFIGKVMSLLFNMLSRLVTAFLPRSKCLLIPWLQSPCTVILESKKIKSVTVSIVSPSICHEVMGQMPWSYFSECWVLSQVFHCPLSLSSCNSLERLFWTALALWNSPQAGVNRAPWSWVTLQPKDPLSKAQMY